MSDMTFAEHRRLGEALRELRSYGLGDWVLPVMAAARQTLDRWQECGECDGNGFEVEERIRIVAEHHPNCDGYTCASSCPIPVPVPEYERVPCPSCGGSGLLPNQGRLDAQAKAGYFDYTGNDPEMMDKDDLREWMSVARAMDTAVRAFDKETE